MRCCGLARGKSSAASIPDHAPRTGETLALGIDMAHACLFDPATQALIPQAVA